MPWWSHGDLDVLSPPDTNQPGTFGIIRTPNSFSGRKPTSKATLFVPKKLTQQTLTFTKASTKSAFLCRKRLEQHVRVRRPIRADYELGNGVQALRGPVDSLDAKPDPHFVKAAETRFIHDDVEDLVTVAVDIRTNQSLRQEFKMGLETTDAVWRRLKAGLYRYARPAKAPRIQVENRAFAIVPCARIWNVGHMDPVDRATMRSGRDDATTWAKEHDTKPEAECIGVPIERQSTDAGDAVQCEELFHCLSCGAFLECRTCCLKRHERAPVHAIQVWRDATWQTISLREIGLVYQLGHQGARCPVPDATPHIMTVMHVNGVHQVEMRYCDCTSKFKLKIVRLQLFLAREFGITPVGVFSPPFQFQRGEDVWRGPRKTDCAARSSGVSQPECVRDVRGWLSERRARRDVRGAARRWLITRLEACHIVSKEELAHLGWLSYNRQFATVFRLALGLSLSGGNWPRLAHLMREFTEPRSTYETVEVDLKKREADQLLLRCGDIVEDVTYNRLTRPGWVTYDTGCQFIWTAMREHNDRERAFDRAFGVERNEADAEEQELPDRGDRDGREDNKILGDRGNRMALGPSVVEYYDYSVYIAWGSLVRERPSLMQASRNPGGRPRANPVFSRPANAPLCMIIRYISTTPTECRLKLCPTWITLTDEYAQAEFEPLLPPEPIYAQDDRDHDDIDSEQEEEEEEEDAGGNNDTTEGGTAKRKRYASSDQPMEEWKPWLTAFLKRRFDDMAGECDTNPRCSSCDRRLKAECIGIAIERPSTEAGDVDEHDRAPVHAIQVWRDATWQTISLRDMGLVYQLGTRELACPTVNIAGSSYYGADCIRLQRDILPLRVRRSGICHEDGGLAEAEDGAIRVECWACPRVGVNLPEDWETVLAEYQRIVSQDANFRMRCKMRSSPYVDLPLYDGLGVQMPTELYHEWLRKYITEEEISSCVAFAALMQKDTRFSVGLRWAGVIGVICARHEIMLGLGDLEKGERFCFILGTVEDGPEGSYCDVRHCVPIPKALQGEDRGVTGRIEELGPPGDSVGLPIWHGGAHEISCETAESLKYKEGVGKTDGEGIERVWSVLNPMSYMTREEQPGARHDDIEDKVDKHNFGKNIHLGRTLLKRLRIALQEKEVQVKGFDVVDEALDDDVRSDWMGMVVDWLKDPAKPNPYAPSEKVSFSESKAKSDLRQQELKEEADDEEEFDASGSLMQRRREQQLADKERKRKLNRRGRRPEAQECGTRLRNERARKENLTTEQQSKVYERRRTQMAKLKVFRKWQDVYMPRVTKIIEKEEVDRRSRSAAVPPVEDARLYLPSECAKSQELDRKVRCPRKLLDKEEALRRGQCSDALGRIRARLLAKRYLVYFRNEHVRGQREGGRAATTLSTMATKLKESVAKYRHCRDRLVALVGEAGCGPFRVLEDEDVKVYQTAESDEDAVRKLSRLEARNSRVTGDSVSARLKKTKRRDVPGETRAVMSWIWTAEGGPDANEDGYLHECVRIEWAKALARKTRWTEEVEILKEEMRRVLRSLRFEEQRWMFRAEKDYHGLRLEEIAGRKAYARRQARDRRRVRESFETLWGMTRPARGQKAGPKDGEAQRAAAAIITCRDVADELSTILYLVSFLGTCNPTYSARCEQLMKYVPASATLIPATNTYNVLEQIVSSLQASDASQETTSPESELLGLLNTPDNAWEKVFTDRINAYADRVLKRLTTQDGVDDYMVLAEGRRMIYQGREDEKPSGGLNEFHTTLPVALKSVPWSEMQEDGRTCAMSSTSKKWFSRRIRAGKDGAFEHRRGSSGLGDGTVPWYLKRTATGGCPMTRAGT
ncbi:hypothetical protein BDZ89DRAFT_1196078 [Hymenopellis radicata]|nr:hypothetical protein BDZ89DRAFT_1196078 [Hymenopellis radicata]